MTDSTSDSIRAEAEKMLAVINERDDSQLMYFPLDERCPHYNINTKSLIEDCIRRGMELEREKLAQSFKMNVVVETPPLPLVDPKFNLNILKEAFALPQKIRELVREWRTRGECINDYAPNVCADELEKILTTKKEP